MASAVIKPLSRCLLTNMASTSIPSIARNPVPFGPNCPSSALLFCRNENLVRNYTKSGHACDQPCRRALKDIPDAGDPECPLPCSERRKKKKGLLYKIKLKLIEGGTNFGTPFRRLRMMRKKKPEEGEKEKKVVAETKNLPVPTKESPPIPDPRPGVQVSILGADTAVGQYCSLLLKQCPQIKKLRLYQSRAEDCCCPPGNITNPCRDMYNIAQDLQHIDTNCLVQAFSCCTPCDLELCLQNTDIVLMLESGYANVNMPFEKRFEYQAPMVKMYADAIAHECPRAMVIVCASPVDCMVPLVAETMKETGWYDKRKVIGSMAVQEMRASTLAARALCLEPRYTRVPCVGGTEGEALVPLFSKAVSYFDFARHNAEMLTDTVRLAPLSVARCESSCMRSADLSEAHALAGLVKSVAHALLCQDIPRISGFVETDASQVISPARFIANTIELNGSGIMNNLGLPALSENEVRQVQMALKELEYKLALVHQWYCRYLALEMLLNNHGICKKFDLPPMNKYEVQLMDGVWSQLQCCVELAKQYNECCRAQEFYRKEHDGRMSFYTPRHYHHIDDCLSMSLR